MILAIVMEQWGHEAADGRRFHARAHSNYTETISVEVVKAERKKGFEESAGKRALERTLMVLPALREIVGVFAA